MPFIRSSFEILLFTKLFLNSAGFYFIYVECVSVVAEIDRPDRNQYRIEKDQIEASIG